MATINEAQDALISDFGMLPDWLDRYQQLIDIAQLLPPAPEDLHQDCNLIKGCQSKVWISCREEGGKLYFETDSDAIITKGIASLLIQVLNARAAEEIAQADLYMIERIGLKENLSPTRANGLVAMIERIKTCAQQHICKSNA